MTAKPAHDSAVRISRPEPDDSGREAGESGAERQLPRPGQRRVERGGRVGTALHRRPPQRRDDHRSAEHPEDTPPRPATRGDSERGGDQPRPHEVELLLHPERPEVQDGRGGVAQREVVAPDRGGVPVRQEECGPEGVGPDLGGPRGGERPRGHPDGEGQDDERERQNPACAPGVERTQRDAAPSLPVAQQDAGDDEARDDEEDVDTEVPAPGPPGDVRRNHAGDGHRAQTLDVRTAVAGCGHPGRRGGCCGGHDAQDLIGARLR